MTVAVNDLVKLTAQVRAVNVNKFPFTGPISEELKAAVVLLRSELRSLEMNLNSIQRNDI